MLKGALALNVYRFKQARQEVGYLSLSDRGQVKYVGS